LLWILALAKARSAAPISAANARPARTSAQRATKASAKINATVAGAKQKAAGPESIRGWRRRSVVIPQLRDGDSPTSLLAIRHSASTRDPLQYFNSLLVMVWVKIPTQGSGLARAGLRATPAAAAGNAGSLYCDETAAAGSIRSYRSRADSDWLPLEPPPAAPRECPGSRRNPAVHPRAEPCYIQTPDGCASPMCPAPVSRRDH